MHRTTMIEKQTILVTGGTGQLGQSLQAIAQLYDEYDFTFVNRSQFDLSDSDNMDSYLSQNKFDVIINCAAHTAVDKAESEPELANQLNHLAVKKMADYVSQYESKLIHISTDYVFDGKRHKPYQEDDLVAPQGVYGQTKLQGELAVKNRLEKNAVIIRTSWVYSEYGNNFVKTMLKLGKERDTLNVIFDQVGTPTYAKDLALAIMDIISSPEFHQNDFETGVIHFSNEGVCSWYDFAKTIFELRDLACVVNPIETKDYPTPAVRPHYSVLNKTKIKQKYQLTIPYWKDSLQQCLIALQDFEK